MFKKHSSNFDCICAVLEHLLLSASTPSQHCPCSSHAVKGMTPLCLHRLNSIHCIACNPDRMLELQLLLHLLMPRIFVYVCSAYLLIYAAHWCLCTNSSEELLALQMTCQTTPPQAGNG